MPWGWVQLLPQAQNGKRKTSPVFSQYCLLEIARGWQEGLIRLVMIQRRLYPHQPLYHPSTVFHSLGPLTQSAPQPSISKGMIPGPPPTGCDGGLLECRFLGSTLHTLIQTLWSWTLHIHIVNKISGRFWYAPNVQRPFADPSGRTQLSTRKQSILSGNFSQKAGVQLFMFWTHKSLEENSMSSKEVQEIP